MTSLRSNAVVAVAAVLTAASAQATDYDIDPTHTTVGFRVRHMMVSWTRGRFEKVEGKVRWDDAAPERSAIEVRIDAASVDTNLKQRDDHLRSADFLDAEKHPSLTFRSTGVEKTKDGYAVAGELTIRGITRPVSLQISNFGPEVRDPWGNFRRGADATATVSRKAFGMTWNAALELGGVAVGDEVQISLEVELIRKA